MAWESYWLIGGLFSWLIVPPLAAWLTVPGFAQIIGSASFNVLTITYVMGLVWGIGGLTYGLGVRYLGCHLGIRLFLDSVQLLVHWFLQFSTILFQQMVKSH